MDTQEQIKNSKAEMSDEYKILEKNRECKCGGCMGKIKCMPKTIKIITAIVGLLLIILLSFAAGAGIALHKARFSCFRGQGMERSFMGPQMMSSKEGGPRGFLREFEGRDFRNGHGLVGTISSISDNNIIVKNGNNQETTVVINNQTAIRNGNLNLKVTDLKQNDKVTIMGKPGDNGAINATLIRIFSSDQGNDQNNQ
jgi:hypothetical protein